MFQTDRVKQILELAGKRARRLGRSEVSAADLLCGLVEEKTGMAARTLGRHHVTLELLESLTGGVAECPVGSRQRFERSVEKSGELEGLLELAENEASMLPRPKQLRKDLWPVVGTEHLLLALLSQESAGHEILCKALESQGSAPKDVRHELLDLLGGSAQGQEERQ